MLDNAHWLLRMRSAIFLHMALRDARGTVAPPYVVPVPLSVHRLDQVLLPHCRFSSCYGRQNDVIAGYIDLQPVAILKVPSCAAPCMGAVPRFVTIGRYARRGKRDDCAGEGACMARERAKRTKSDHCSWLARLLISGLWCKRQKQGIFRANSPLVEANSDAKHG